MFQDINWAQHLTKTALAKLSHYDRLKCNSHFLWAKGQQCPTKCQRWSCFRRQLGRNIKMIWKQSGNMFTLHQHPMWCKLYLTEHSYPKKCFLWGFFEINLAPPKTRPWSFVWMLFRRQHWDKPMQRNTRFGKKNRHSSNLQPILN